MTFKITIWNDTFFSMKKFTYKDKAHAKLINYNI